MTVVFTIQHPGHVHLFRHAIDAVATDTQVEVVVRDKEMTVDLLDAYGIDHTVLGAESASPSRLPLDQVRYEFNVWRHVRRLDPSVVVGVGGLTASHVATLTGATSIVFIDNETWLAPSNRVVVPLADVVCTPETLEDDFGDAQVRYAGFHELAYLHPNRFDPDPTILERNGVDPDESYAVVRFVGWKAHHDVGQTGFSLEQKRTLVESLAERGNLYITSESPLPPGLEQYRLPVDPEYVHHLLARADVYVGDSGTMATEAAVLGTPSIRLLPRGIERELSNFRVLEERYGLLLSMEDPEATITRAVELMDDPESEIVWRERRDALLEDSIDVTAFVVCQIQTHR